MTDEAKKRRRFVEGKVNPRLKEYNQKVDDAEARLEQLDPHNIPPDTVIDAMQQQVKSALPGGGQRNTFSGSLVNALEQIKRDDEFVPGQNQAEQDEWRSI